MFFLHLKVLLCHSSAESTPATWSNDLLSKFKKPAGSWECDTCMINNDAAATKCVACEAPKPGLKPLNTAAPVPNSSSPAWSEDIVAKFKKPTGSWECEVCMISNDGSLSKCAACESPRPGQTSEIFFVIEFMSIC